MADGNGAESGVKGRHCTAFIPGIGTVDGRTRQAKAFEATVEALVTDMGGPDGISRAELEIVRRAAGLGVLAAQIEAQIVAGETVAATEYQTVANAQGRLLSRLGLQRRARDVTPTLKDYLASRAESAA